MAKESLEEPMDMPFDAAKAEAFAEKVVSSLNGGATALMISLGHRSGLFDCMAEMGPSSSDAIARRAGLTPRYVREWLGAMVVSGIVNNDPVKQTYVLPPEHAANLTRAAGSGNLATFAQYIGLLGTVEDLVLECFRKGGGVPYEKFGRFQEVMAEESGMTVLPALIDSILPLLPGGVADLQRGIDVLDVGCGSGRALNLMAKTFPNSRFLGVDISREGIAAARREAASLGLSNARFEIGDVAALDQTQRYDLITAFDAIHDQAKPRQVLANIARALRPGGSFLMQDIGASSHHHENQDHPVGPLLYTVSCMHCMTVSLASGGEGLGAMWGEQKARELLAEAGFRDVTLHRLPHDIQNWYYVVRS